MNARTPELQAAAGIVLQRARGETSAPASAAGRARWWVPVARIAVLQITDFAALCVAAALAYLVWAGAILHQPAGVYLSITPTLLCLPLGYAAVGLYPGFGIGAVEALRRYTLCTTFAFLALASATFFLKLPHEFSRATFFFAWLGALIIVPAARLGVVLIFSRRAWWRKEVVLVGTKSWVERTLRELTQAPAIGYRPTAILLTESKRRLDISLPGVRELSDPLGLMHEARAGSCDVLVEDGGRLNLLYSRVLRHFQRVVIFANYRNLPIEGARPCLLGGMLGVQITNNLLLRRNRVVKRILDVVLSSAMLIAAVPLIGLSALLIPLFDWGVPFYSQERRGLGGRSIRVWKLRTMHRDAEERLKTHLAADPAEHAEWFAAFKLRNDPRVVPLIGPLLRRFSIDELPQLWSVVKGEMSLVGPRPFPDYHLEQLTSEHRQSRKDVRPGLTGLWQVMVRSDGGMLEQQHYDLYYVRNWSIWLDLYVMGRTVVKVLSGRGAV